MKSNSRKAKLVYFLSALVIFSLIFVGSIQAETLILSEDFEDGILDSRISIETTGTFNSNPDIKDISNFGSTKAFGYGRSTCPMNCFDNYVTNFKITLNAPTYISTISFKEMELYDNWGSKGTVYIDGLPNNFGHDFGRLPHNDRQADTIYREKNFFVNKDVATIELEVYDITNLSEIFIDDLIIYGDFTDTVWHETFESYIPGTFPNADWTYTGNGDIYVDSSISSEGVQSLRYHGSPGGCYEAIPCRPLEVSTSEGFVIEFSIYTSSNHVEGCHSWTGGAGLFNVCDWTQALGVAIVNFWYDGHIGSRIGSLGTYAYDTWYKIKMRYERETASTVKISYWLDGIFKGSQIVEATPYEDDLIYFHGSSGDGTVWMDDIKVSNLTPDCVEDDSGALDIVGSAGAPGGTVTIPVRIQNAPNAVGSLGFEVTFNPCVLEFTEFTRGSLVEDFDFFDCVVPTGENSIVRCGGFKATGGIAEGASGDVAYMNFDVIECEQGLQYPLDLQELKDDIAGWSTSLGCFQCGCSCDINGDGEVTPQDALCAFQKYLGICPTSCGLCEDICCDVNGDDQCTPADALEIFKEYLGMESVCSPLTLKVDQVNDVDTGTSRGCGAPPMGLGSLFQSFTPSASPLAAVDLRLRVGGDFPDTGYQTTIRVRSGTPEADVLGTAAVFVPGPQATGAELEVHFEFSPSVSLSPGQTYVIEWVSPLEGGVVFTWMVADYDSYPGGTAYGCTGSIIEDEDFIFTTYTIAQ